jgi:uncharacterized protein (DUF934 family)
MRQIIHRRELRADDVRYLDEEAVPGFRRAISVAQFLSAVAEGQSSSDAIVMAPTDEVESLAPYLSRLTLIAVDFPKVGEGRGYTQARLLRQRYHFAGELRARGALKRDQLFFLARCGFDSFQLDDSENLEAALAAFNTFSVAYQDGAQSLVQVKRRDSGLTTA